MNRYTVGLLIACTAFACVAADASTDHEPHPFDASDDDDDHHAHANILPTTTRIPKDKIVVSVARSPEWTFSPGNYGPETWAKYYPKCGQLNQSPINIESRKVIPAALKPLKFNNFEKALNNVVIQNTYRFGSIDFTGSPTTTGGGVGSGQVTVEGGPLPVGVRYYLNEAYYTVGKNYTDGSVNSIDGRRAPFEIAFVFNSHANATIETQDIGSEVVIHFLGKIAPKDNPNYIPVIAGLKKVTQGGSQTSANIKSLRSLFPRKAWQANYYTYTGSSNIPPCTEGRIRIVYQTPILLSAQQLKVLQGLKNEKGELNWNNYRPQQANTYVQVFRSIQTVPRTRTTTRRPVMPKANILADDPYAPVVLTPTTTPKANILIQDPYAADVPKPTTTPRANVLIKESYETSFHKPTTTPKANILIEQDPYAPIAHKPTTTPRANIIALEDPYGPAVPKKTTEVPVNIAATTEPYYSQH